MDRLITQTFKIDDVLTAVTSAKLSEPNGTYGIKRDDLSTSSITAATQADPVVLTAAGHGLSSGQMIHVSSVVGMTELNGNEYYVDVTGNALALYSDSGLTTSVDGSAYTLYDSAGTVTPVEIADDTAMTGGAGTYSYTLSGALQSVAYTAYIEFVYDGDTFYVEYDLPAWIDNEDLDLTWSTIRIEIADFLGWTRDSDNWSNDEVSRLQAAIESGYRQFIYPPIAPGETVAYRWKFLRPTATLTTVDGTYLYDMPAAFGAMIGDLVYDDDQDVHRIIEQTTPGMIDRNRAVDSLTDGRPYLFALRPKSTSQATEQVEELMLYPTPDSAYPLLYHYDAKVDVLSSTYPYPLGGQAHSEALLQSCRDIADTRYNDNPSGREHQLFLERLKASIESDRRLSPKTLGMNNDGQRIVYTRHGTEFSVSLDHNLGGG